MLEQEKLEKLKENVGKFVEVEVYNIYDTYHDDDIDHCGDTEIVRGQLNSVVHNGITVSGRFLSFFEVSEDNRFARGGQAITLILCGKDFLYDAYNIVPKDIEFKHKLKHPGRFKK